MENLESYNLEDLGFLGRGKSRHRPRNEPSLFGGKYPFIQTGEVKAAEFYINSFEDTYNEKGLAQSKLWEPGTLLITIAANIAETAILDMKACFPDSILGFIPDEDKADVRFIKYYIDTIKLKMQSISRGTTQDNLSLQKLRSIDFEVPSVSEQRKIADVLTAFDDLISTNRRRIEILEEMARRIYREWFVHFRYPGHGEDDPSTSSGQRLVDSGTELGGIPEGWEVKEVDDIVNRLSKGNIYRKKNTDDEGDIIIIDQSTDEYLGFHDNEPDFPASPDEPFIIFGDHTCKMQLLIRPFSLGPNVVPFIAENEELSNYYLYYLLEPVIESREYKRHWTTFKVKKIVVAPTGIAHKFEKKVRPFIEQKENLKKQINKLKETRDLLLPNLISGKIGLKEIAV